MRQKSKSKTQSIKTAGKSIATAIVAIGDELLRDRVDTNSREIRTRLAAHGWEIRMQCQVPDDQNQVAVVLHRLMAEYGLVICCGGLGPTQDDITRQAVAQAVQQPLVYDAPTAQAMAQRFKKRGIAMPANNRIQAMFPSRAHILPNHWGTAAGFWLTTPQGIVAALPGPPNECLPMLEQELCRHLCEQQPEGTYPSVRAVMRVCMLPESKLQEVLGPLFPAEGPVDLGFLLDEPGEILVLLTVRNQPAQQAKGFIAKAKRVVQKSLGVHVVDPEAKSLAEVVGRLLLKNKQTVATAESCTGGLLAQRLTAVPGSSRYFLEGAVTYSNAAKQRQLGVPKGLLEQQGAVSEAVARCMALGMQKKSKADWCVSVTGIAGPGGGSTQKPVGLVFAGFAGPGQHTQVVKHMFLGDRERIQRLSATAALDHLRRLLLAGMNRKGKRRTHVHGRRKQR